MQEINRETWTMTLEVGHHENLQEARKESANGCSWSRQDQHPLPSQILHCSCIQIPASKFFRSSLSKGKKNGSNTCIYPTKVKICRKGQILILCTSQAPKEVVRNKTSQNPQSGEHSGRSKHLHSLQIHPPFVQWEPR